MCWWVDGWVDGWVVGWMCGLVGIYLLSFVVYCVLTMCVSCVSYVCGCMCVCESMHMWIYACAVFDDNNYIDIKLQICHLTQLEFVSC